VRTILALTLLCPIACSARQHQRPLVKVAEVSLPGPAKRFDYQTLDPTTGRLYISHMGGGTVVVFDTKTNKVIADLKGYPVVTGVLAVPEEGKLYASATGSHEVIVTDLKTLQPIAKIKGADFPDGIAYASKERKIFVSDESGGIDLVIDAKTNKEIATIPLGGEAGNTHYDAINDRIWVAVQTKNEMVEIDPKTNEIVARHPLNGADGPHGFLIDEDNKRMYISCEGNNRLFVTDLAAKQLQSFSVADGPDVLAMDRKLGLLYVGCEGGEIDVFKVEGQQLKSVGAFTAPNAHTVAVDQRDHRVFVPLKDVNGKPQLWILQPVK